MYIAKQRVQEWISRGDVIRELTLVRLGLTELPDIPASCVRFDCSHNYLKKLPDLPNCVSLRCVDNELIELPELPNCTSLSCSKNLLTSLPELPLCRVLFCYENKLTSLPKLPDHAFVDCTDNELTSVPDGVLTMITVNNRYLYFTPKQCKALVKRPTPNFPKFAFKIQNAYRGFKQRRAFKELNKIYIKNVSLLISRYV